MYNKEKSKEELRLEELYNKYMGLSFIGWENSWPYMIAKLEQRIERLEDNVNGIINWLQTGSVKNPQFKLDKDK